MTSVAALRSAAIDTYYAAIDLILLRVALSAADHAMRAIQRVIGLAVIERPGTPFGNRVATGTILLFSGDHELTPVGIFVALETLLGRMGEIRHGLDPGRDRRLGGRGHVTPDAGGVLMRPL